MMPVDSDDWWDVDPDPVEDALSDCRNGHHGVGGRALAAEVERLRSRLIPLEALADVVNAFYAEHLTFDAAERWSAQLGAALDAVPCAETD